MANQVYSIEFTTPGSKSFPIKFFTQSKTCQKLSYIRELTLFLFSNSERLKQTT